MGTPVASVVTTTIGGRVRHSWYVERPATGPAGHLIACAWHGLPGWSRRIRLLPDGCVDLVWDGTTLTVAPATPSATRIAIEPGAITTGIRLRAHAAVTLLGRPVPRLDAPTPLTGLWPHAPAARLTAALHASAPDTVSTHLIRAAAEGLRDPDRRPSPLVAAFIDRLAQGATVEAAARAIGTTGRTIRRHVHADTALTPKRLQEILRLRRALPTLATAGLAHTAADAGYYDQAHLTRQIRALTGTTPAALAAVITR